MSEKTSLQIIAQKLGITNELLQHHRFMSELKSFIVDVCKQSGMDRLKELVYKNRIDIANHWDIALNDELVNEVTKEITDQHQALLTPEQQTTLLVDTHP